LDPGQAEAGAREAEKDENEEGQKAPEAVDGPLDMAGNPPAGTEAGTGHDIPPKDELTFP